MDKHPADVEVYFFPLLLRSLEYFLELNFNTLCSFEDHERLKFAIVGAFQPSFVQGVPLVVTY